MAEDATTYRRPFHRLVARALAMLDGDLLAETGCLFGGGTRSVLALGEYRESRDVDFLCADREGYRSLRAGVARHGVAALFREPVALRRDVRLDMDGIRTVLEIDGAPLKFEIVVEGRLTTLQADSSRCLGVPQLAQEAAFAEKFLANADRALDASVLARDAIDLAFQADGWGLVAARSGLTIAETAYGEDVQEKLDLAVARLQQDRTWRTHCVRGLAIDDPKRLRAGLEKLQAKAWRSTRLAGHSAGTHSGDVTSNSTQSGT